MGTAPGCPPLSAPPTTSMRLEALPHGRPTARKYSASRRIRRAPQGGILRLEPRRVRRRGHGAAAAAGRANGKKEAGEGRARKSRRGRGRELKRSAATTDAGRREKRSRRGAVGR